jgi:hypothetical protein
MVRLWRTKGSSTLASSPTRELIIRRLNTRMVMPGPGGGRGGQRAGGGGRGCRWGVQGTGEWRREHARCASS